MFPPGASHYDPAIDGTLSDEGLRAVTAEAGRAARGKAIYTRAQLISIVAGALTKLTYQEDRVRRVWPDEPNVGFSEPEMAFKVDGNLRLGGPTLKTYVLNDLSLASRTRESLVTMNDTYRKLQASEDGLEQADMLNAVGAWMTNSTANAGDDLGITETEIKTDARTYLAASGTVIQLLRRGTYEISYRALGIPSVGDLTATLTVGSSTYTWSGTGLPTTLTITERITYEKSDDTAENVTLTLTTGTRLGAATPDATHFGIVKLR